jgi:uncharacterized membrane protein
MNTTLGAIAHREPRARPASDGWRWIREAFSLVGAKPGFWIGSAVLVVVAFLVLGILPFVGQLATLLLGPFVVAGYAHAARRQARGEGPALDDLLIGFRRNPGALVAVALMYLVGVVIVVAVVFGILFATIGAAAFAGGGEIDPAVLSEAWMSFAIAWLIGLALLIPLLMAYWFAPQRIVFDDLDAITAMKTSFFGCLRNIVPFIVYGLVLIPIFIIAALPLLLGLLVVVPMLFATYYTAWRAVFGEE